MKREWKKAREIPTTQSVRDDVHDLCRTSANRRRIETDGDEKKIIYLHFPVAF